MFTHSHSFIIPHCLLQVFPDDYKTGLPSAQSTSLAYLCWSLTLQNTITNRATGPQQ